MKIKLMAIILVLIKAGYNLTAQIPYPGEAPGQAVIRSVPESRIILENKVISMEFAYDGKKISIRGIEDKKSKDQIRSAGMPLFEISMKNNKVYTSDDFVISGSPVISDLIGNRNSHTFAERMPGKKYSAVFENSEIDITVHWAVELKDGSNYIRQFFSFTAKDADKVNGINLIKLPLTADVKKIGTVDGSPMVHKNMFFALEYPLSKIEQNEKYIISYLPRLQKDVSTVWGVTPHNQLRRGFLYYVERERAHPYHQVLHYNSWYDISWDDRKFTENECLDRIKLFGDSLINKRHIPMKGFLFDDGWDDNKTLWKFHAGFPDGFAKLKKAAQSYNSDIGVWFSPFGGYGNSKLLRMEYGKKQNPPFETNEQGFSLSGPVYYNRFKEVTGNFIKDYNVCMFKFDGVGMGNGAGLVYQKDVEAFLKLLKDLLGMKPDIYLSLTTGTWPSVYWLMYGDNIWRGGDDTNVMGEGPNRQKWITYRDADTYKNVVLRGPLYPLNSLMLCGICIADNGIPGSFEMDNKNISDEIWSLFATGTNLQELYINPHKLKTADWNCLADAAKWAKENEKVMTDVHWVGGDPSKEEVYGFAAWSPEKAILSLRNPSKIVKSFEVKVAGVLELPDNMKDDYLFYDARAYGAAGEKKPISGKSFTITLQPFEVRVFNAVTKN